MNVKSPGSQRPDKTTDPSGPTKSHLHPGTHSGNERTPSEGKRFLTSLLRGMEGSSLRESDRKLFLVIQHNDNVTKFLLNLTLRSRQCPCPLRAYTYKGETSFCQRERHNIITTITGWTFTRIEGVTVFVKNTTGKRTPHYTQCLHVRPPRGRTSGVSRPGRVSRD